MCLFGVILLGWKGIIFGHKIILYARLDIRVGRKFLLHNGICIAFSSLKQKGYIKVE
jgi:hypothetical protein